MGVHRRYACWALGLIAALAAGAPAEETSAPGWTRYRSDKFGYVLSYPPEVNVKAYLDGVSAEIRDARTNAPLAELEVWPPDECPRQSPGLTAKALGVERVTTATQADGPDGSSWCGEPVTLRERVSTHGVAIFEVDLTCKSERVPGPADRPAGGKPVVATEGKKGPTYFADISVPWRKRILSADPVGIDPRLRPPREPPRPALVLEVLETLETFPTDDPQTICIEDLRQRGVTAARPAPAIP
jgi:hypothetical protein